MRGHPVFIAQHATATCCRGCLAKWHGIERGRTLTVQEQAHAVAAIGRWLQTQVDAREGAADEEIAVQEDLFGARSSDATDAIGK